ncbi:MAG: glycoside hydrolase family 15 protein, partial [Myxococcaceae bacterium]
SRLRAIGGANAVYLDTPVPTSGRELTTVAEFEVRRGERVPFVLTWHPSHLPAPPAVASPLDAVEDCAAWWRAWVSGCTYDGSWRDAVVRSLITLKALTFAPTGGIVAAPTTSLPERIGGVRNWDYRYCWLRDATFTLYALMISGYRDEARAWRDWLLRAIGGDPARMQTLYGPAGERRLVEERLDWLPGYEGSRPVRIGNAALSQLQLDIYGEVMDSLTLARRLGIDTGEDDWMVQKVFLAFLESKWTEPDRGIWEVRGAPRHFTYSKVMAWVAVDRAIKSVERFGLGGPAEHWRKLRATIHEDVCTRGYDPARNSFTQSYGSKELDAALLLAPLVGFLPPTDERMRGTVAAIERELCRDGLVQRYSTGEGAVGDSFPPGEGAFLACSFWLADNYAISGRTGEARALFERLLALRNDVGLLSEEYDPGARRLLGNFPQAFSHVALVNTARNLSRAGGPAEHRPGH